MHAIDFYPVHTYRWNRQLNGKCTHQSFGCKFFPLVCQYLHIHGQPIWMPSFVCHHNWYQFISSYIFQCTIVQMHVCIWINMLPSRTSVSCGVCIVHCAINRFNSKEYNFCFNRLNHFCSIWHFENSKLCECLSFQFDVPYQQWNIISNSVATKKPFLIFN